MLTVRPLQPHLYPARTVFCGSTKALSAQIASSYKANSTIYRVQFCLSSEAKAKAPLCANSIAESTSLTFIVPSTKDLCREARNKASLSANNEPILASLEGKAMHNKGKLASKGRVKTVASLCEATLSDEAILASPITKKKAFKAKPKAFQPKRLTLNPLESL